MKKYLASVLMGLVLSGCAIGPLVSHETARTVGDGNSESIIGHGQAGLLFKWNYGVSENFDLGIHAESLSIGIRGKYAFLNQSAGWSLAAALGQGASVGGNHYYADFMGSYVAGSWEPYGTLRFVHVKTDPLEFRDTDTGEVTFVINQEEYDYGQYILGAKYWFTQNWFFSLEATQFFPVTSGVEIGNATMTGAALGYRF